MRKRQLIWLAAAVLLTLGVKLLIDRARLPARAASRPDIVMISIDTLRADHLSCYGYPRPTSPGIDRLAAGATVFDNAFSQSPKTAISHMSLFTGLYPVAHGVRQWTEDSGERLSEDIPTLATLLSRRGYQTAGLSGGGHMRYELGFDQGFDHWEKVGWLRKATSRGLDLVRRMGTDPSRPYFFFLHTYAVHDPYVPPRRYREMFVDPAYAGSIVGDSDELEESAGGGWVSQHEFYWDRVDRDDPADIQRLIDLYDAGIRRMDDEISEFLDTLQADGLLDNAIIVLLSDHGEEFLEHGDFLHNQVYQELLHVPLIIRWPGPRGAAFNGRRVGAIAQLVDLAPTLLDFLGLPIPGHVQGRSLLPVLESGATTSGVVLSDWERARVRSLRAGDWKLVRREGRVELYNLADDPGETRDLAASEPERVEELARAMASLIASSREIRQSVSAGETVVPDDETLEELRALGYID